MSILVSFDFTAGIIAASLAIKRQWTAYIVDEFPKLALAALAYFHRTDLRDEKTKTYNFSYTSLHDPNNRNSITLLNLSFAPSA